MLKALNNIKMKGISAKISKLRLKMETLEAQAKQKQEELEAIQAKLNFHIGFCSTPIPIPPDYKTNPEASKRYGLKKSEQFQVQQLIKEEISAEIEAVSKLNIINSRIHNFKSEIEYLEKYLESKI